MMVYRRHELSRAKQNAGFIAAVVCEPYEQDEIQRFSKAFSAGTSVLFKGQRFMVEAAETSSIGTVLFGLKPAVQHE